MYLANLRRNATKSVFKPSHSSPHSTVSTQLNPRKSYASPMYTRSYVVFLSNRLFQLHFLRNPTIFPVQSCNFCNVSEKAVSVCENAQQKQIADFELETVQQAQMIAAAIGNCRSIDAAMRSATSIDSLSPNLVLEVLKRLSNAGALALSFFRWAERRGGFENSWECYNCLIESLGKIKQFKMVWLLVDEMQSKGLLCADTFALISRRLARAKRAKEAVEAFEKMEKNYGMKPKLQDYNRLLDTLSKSRQLERAQIVFDKWKNTRFKPDIKSYTILLEGWGQECNFLRLNEVFREMKEDGFKPDVVNYGILINAHCKGRKYDDAVRLYHEMVMNKINPTPHIYCTLINGLGSAKRLKEAIEFFELCRRSCSVLEAPTYNALVGAYCKSSRIQDAYSVVDEMRECGVGPNTRTYDIILHHLVKLQRKEEAYSVYQKMRGECEPTVSTYEIMVRMFCNERRLDMALCVWNDMKARGVLPGMHMFSALIHSLCSDRKIDDACRYFHEMIDMGIRPPDRTFKLIKQCLVKEGKKGIVDALAYKVERLRKAPLLG